MAADRDAQRLFFTLRRTTGNTELSKPMLHNPLLERRTVLQLSVGVAGSEPVPGVNGEACTLPFKKPYVDGWTCVSGAALALVLALTVCLGQRSDMLRDAPSTAGSPRPRYSLARVQMAWWFVLVVAGFTALLLVTGDTDSLPAFILALTGISALTGVAALVVAPGAEQRQAARQAALAAHAAAIDTALAGAAEARARLESLGQELAATQSSAQDTGTLDALASSLRQMPELREREARQLAAQPPPTQTVALSRGFL